jgi:chemotaxis signal transduction protein
MRQQRTLPRRGAREDVILFTVGGFRFGIAANAVSEIRSMAGLRRFSGSGQKMPPKIDYTLERDGVTHFVVNGARHFHLPQGEPTRVLVLRQAAAAVLVDSTDRITEISVLHALPLAFNREERNWYRGLAVLNEEAVPVVNPSAFLSKIEITALRSMTDSHDRVAQPPSAVKVVVG